MLITLAILAYIAGGTYTAGWAVRADKDECDKNLMGPSATPVGVGVVTFMTWPIVQVGRLGHLFATRVASRPLKALYAAGYRRPGDKEKALLEAENAADRELAALEVAKAEMDLEQRLNRSEREVWTCTATPAHDRDAYCHQCRRVS